MPLNVTRRQFFALGGAAGAIGLGGMGWTGSLYQTQLSTDLTVTHYDLATAKWSTGLPPLRIAFLTDLHVGCSSVNLDVLRRIITQVNALPADIVLLGGDYLTRLHQRAGFDYIPPQPIAEIVGTLRAPLGVYSVLGNHDWYTDGLGMTEALIAHNITVLENNALQIQQQNWDFWLVGLADYLTRKPDYQTAIQNIDNDTPRIVLSHDPLTFAKIDDTPVIQLSGHTHGGQIAFPLVGPVVMPTPGTPLDWAYGLVSHENRQMIVSSGVGTSVLPLKNTPNEVVLLTLSTAKV